jgi:hypothetical protein
MKTFLELSGGIAQRSKEINKDNFSLLHHVRKIIYFCGHGEMAEWSKAHAWKVCNRQKRFMGSNPILSAIFSYFNRLFYSVYRCLMSGKFNFDFMLIFSLLMVILYVGIGVYLLVTPKYDYIPKEIKGIFAVFFILYGVFRFVRIYPNLTKKNGHENE